MAIIDFLILGHGHTAEALIKKISASNPEASIQSTSRSDSSKIYFDLNDSSSWENLPNAKVYFWTFPPEPEKVMDDFLKDIKSKYEKLIVIGSTSAFKTEKPHQVVTEKTPLDLEKERVRCEAKILQQGGIVVFSSGIYGAGRNPLDWVSKGMVGKSSKLVNMIHVDDLAQFLVQAEQWGQPGTLYIASDNNPQSWREIIENWEQRGLIKDVSERESQRASKKIDNSWSINELQISLQYQNFADSIS